MASTKVAMLKLNGKRLVKKKKSRQNISMQTFQNVNKLDLIIMAFRRKNG